MTITRRTRGLSLWAQTTWVSNGARFTPVIFGILLLLGMGATPSAQAQVESVIHNFGGVPGDGYWPYAGLVMDSSGNLYGTTSGGGASNAGTVFKLDTSGTLTVLHSFAGGTNDGAYPEGGLLLDSSGNLYGTTRAGGASLDLCPEGCGTVFELVNSSGTYTEKALHIFSYGDGQYPHGVLVIDPSGNLYGTTNGGGASGLGTVFKLDASSTVTVLHNFTDGDGAPPIAGLVRDPSGNLYGSICSGGAYGDGTAFKLDSSGTLTVLHSFSGSEGTCPLGLVRDSSGNFYGMTNVGGSFGYGTVFKLDTSGTLTVLHSFSFGDGVYPYGPLVRDSSGNLYGMTPSGGNTSECLGFGCGTVFKLDMSGTLTVLHSFSGSDGENPKGVPVRDSSGNLYGTTYYGGASYSYNSTGYGTVFGIAPVTLSATSLDFGTVAVNTTSPAQTVTITNIGSGNFSYNSALLSGANAADFIITSNICSTAVAPGGTCSVSLSFTPNTASSELASLDLSQGGMTQTVSLTGTGAFATANLSATGLTFLAQPVGATSSAQTLTVTNTGTVTLNITAVSISGDFAIASNTCTASVAAGQSCTVGVTFSPTMGGTRTGTLSFTDNAASSPQSVTLTGDGEDFSVSARTTSVTISAGGTASYDLLISPAGGFSGNVSLTCSGAPSKSTCLVNPASVTLNGTDNSAVTLKVTTTAASGMAPHFHAPWDLPPMAVVWFGLFVLLGLGVLGRFGPARARMHPALVASLAAMLLAITFWTACGGGGPSTLSTKSGTPAGTYTLTGTGASGNLSHSTTVSLTVR